MGLVYGFGLRVGWLGFSTTVADRAVAARRCLSLGAARSGKRRARARHGGGRREGRAGSGPRGEVRAGRAGRGRRGLLTERGRAGTASTDRRGGEAAEGPQCRH